ncbi:MAG: DoxX family protein [Terriglobia bacterium]
MGPGTYSWARDENGTGEKTGGEMEQGAGRKTLVLCRVILGSFFLLFGQYKVATPAFAHGGLQNYLHSFISDSAYPFFKPVLQNLVLPHATFFGYFVGVGELLIGLSLVLGAGVGLSSMFGFTYMMALAFSTGYRPDWPLWRYFGANLEHFCPALLFLIFLSSHGGRSWGLDSFLHKRYLSFKILF